MTMTRISMRMCHMSLTKKISSSSEPTLTSRLASKSLIKTLMICLVTSRIRKRSWTHQTDSTRIKLRILILTWKRNEKSSKCSGTSLNRNRKCKPNKKLKWLTFSTTSGMNKCPSYSTNSRGVTILRRSPALTEKTLKGIDIFSFFNFK